MAFGKSEQASIAALLAIALMAVATLFQLIGLATNHWVDTVSEQYGLVGYSGLWQTCSNFGLAKSSCRGFYWTDVQVSHWFRTVQAMETIGFLLAATSLLMVCLKYFVETCYTNRFLKIISTILLVLAFLLVMSAGVVVGALKDVQHAIEIESTTHMSWSFALSICACILYLFSSLALCVTDYF